MSHKPISNFDLLALPREQRDALYGRIMNLARQAGLQGMAGECAEAAIAINQVIFNNQGKLVAGVNQAFFDAGELVGHVAVMLDGEPDGAYYDIDGVPKPLEQILSWGMLEADDDYWRERADEAWFDLDEASAEETCAITFNSANSLLEYLPGSGLTPKIKTLQQAMRLVIRQHLACGDDLTP